jgi:hypothetical protein
VDRGRSPSWVSRVGVGGSVARVPTGLETELAGSYDVDPSVLGLSFRDALLPCFGPLNAGLDLEG